MNACSHPPNVPPVTVHQIIRYLGRRYADARKRSRSWESQLATSPETCHPSAPEYLRIDREDASTVKLILFDLRYAQIGEKENRP